MVRNFLFCLLFSFAGLSIAQEASFTLSEDDLICYNALKEAVLERGETTFKGYRGHFNELFPEPTQEAVEWLGFLATEIQPWQETNPPRTIAKVGTKEIPLYGTIALIIYNATSSGNNQWISFLQSFAFPGIPSKDGDLVFNAIAKAAQATDITSEKDLIDFIKVLYKKVPHAFGPGQMDTTPLTKNIDPECIRITNIMSKGSMYDRILVNYAVIRAVAKRDSNTRISKVADRLFLAAEVVELLGIKQLLSLNELKECVAFLALKIANA